VQRFEVQDKTVPVNLQGLPEGVYLIQIKTDKSVDSIKIIKYNK